MKNVTYETILVKSPMSEKCSLFSSLIRIFENWSLILIELNTKKHGVCFMAKLHGLFHLKQHTFSFSPIEVSI